jgi:hypothetical protein
MIRILIGQGRLRSDIKKNLLSIRLSKVPLVKKEVNSYGRVWKSPVGLP